MDSRLPSLAVLALLACLMPAPAQADDTPLYDELPDERVLYVAPGQTLGGLVRKAYPDQPDRWAEIEGWIVDHNPHAFIDGDPSKLRGDVRLQLPRASRLARRQSEAGGDMLQDFDLVFDGRFLFVNPSQSLKALVPRVYPDQPARWDAITEAILERNREIMRDRGTSTTIARGTRLVIPNVVEGDARTQDPEAEPIVGEAVAVEGAVHVTDTAGHRRGLETGAAVRRGDTVSTAAGASARIEFRDGEELHVRADSRIRVRKWSLPDVGPGQRVIGLLKGGLRAISGALGNRQQDDYRTITPAATMGIRGTDYSLQLCEVDECSNASGETLREGLYVGVASGEIELLNAGGDAIYGAGEYGYVASSDVAPTHVDAGSAPAAVSGEPGGADDDGRGWLIGIGALLLLAL